MNDKKAVSCSQLRLAHEPDRSDGTHEGGMGARTWEKKIQRGTKPLRLPPKIIHVGQSGFTASFLGKNERRGWDLVGNRARDGGGGVRGGWGWHN